MAKRKNKSSESSLDAQTLQKRRLGCAIWILIIIAAIFLPKNKENTPSPTGTPRQTAVVIVPAPLSASTPRPTLIAASHPVTFYTVGSVVGRSCPELTCEVVASFPDGEAVEVIANEQGEAINGDTLWRVVKVNGQQVHIHNSGVIWGGAVSALSSPTRNTNTPRAVSQATTKLSTRTPGPTNTPRPVGQTITYYTLNTARLRSCPQLTTSCEKTSVSGGTTLQVITNIQGAEFNGSTLWYIVDYQGERLYVHSALVSRNRPAPVVPTQPQSQAPIMQSTPPPAQQAWSCQGDQYNCDDFTTCAAAKDYFAACPGDPSRLDGNNDGIPCNARGYVCG